MKGKKYTAAERHFLEQKERLDKANKHLRDSLEQAQAQLQVKTKEAEALRKENQELSKENQELRQRLEYLQNLHGLSSADVRAAVEKDRTLAETCRLLRMAI